MHFMRKGMRSWIWITKARSPGFRHWLNVQSMKAEQRPHQLYSLLYPQHLTCNRQTLNTCQWMNVSHWMWEVRMTVRLSFSCRKNRVSWKSELWMMNLDHTSWFHSGTYWEYTWIICLAGDGYLSLALVSGKESHQNTELWNCSEVENRERGEREKAVE